MSRDRRIILLTGLSGAGKTTATKSLEDIGFRTIDNLPYELLPHSLRRSGKIQSDSRASASSSMHAMEIRVIRLSRYEVVPHRSA